MPPEITACAPKRELCPLKRGLCPKKETCLVPLECSSRSETPKILIITPKFVKKKRYFADFAVKTFFGLHPRIRVQEPFFRRFCGKYLCFLVFTLEIEGTKFLCPPKNCLCPPPVTLLWCRACVAEEGCKPIESIRKVIDKAKKLLFFAANSQKITQRLEALPPRPPQ